MSMRSKFAVVAGVSSVLGLAAAANAALKVEFTNTFGTTITVDDNGPFDGSPGVTGLITYSAVIWGMDIQVVVAQSNAPGAADRADLQIQSLSIIAGAGTDRVLRVRAVEDAFFLPGTVGSELLLTSDATVISTGVAGSTASFFSTASPNFVSTPVLNFNVAATPYNQSQGNEETFNRTASPFSISGQFDLVVKPNSVMNLTGASTVIPEPASASVLALGGVALLRRRR